tara:strand:+ start:675 stop:1673 length:999 start_codon:yes stop_codon:yes gene_type:complete
MPLIAIREVLTGEFNDWTAEADGEMKIAQKKINLEEGYKYRVKNVQVFNDKGGILSADSSDTVSALLEQTYVTPYPIVLNDETVGVTSPQRGVFLQSGPFAADNNVLYKEIELQMFGREDPTIVGPTYSEQFPFKGLEQLNAQRWYTPHLFLTVIQSFGGEGIDNEISKSFYIELEKTKCGVLERSIGHYKEFLESQCRLITETANFIDPTSSAAGRSIPSWKFGGIRPEFMLNANNTLRYFNRVAARDYQPMMTSAAFTNRFGYASTMVEYDSAFGSDFGSGNKYPDWINVYNVAGINSGPIRPFPPPHKLTGNGNTVMYDEDGNPASIVT